MYLWRCYQCFHPVSTPSPLFPDMTLDDVRDYERNMHEKTNIKVVNYHEQQEHSTSKPSSLDDIEIHDKPSVCPFSLSLFHHISFFWCLWMKYRVRIHPLILSHTETTATEDRRSEWMMRSRLFCATRNECLWKISLQTKLKRHSSDCGSNCRTSPPAIVTLIYRHFPEVWDATEKRYTQIMH